MSPPEQRAVGWHLKGDVPSGFMLTYAVLPAADPRPIRSASETKFHYGLDLHFLHHPVAMGFDGAFCAT